MPEMPTTTLDDFHLTTLIALSFYLTAQYLNTECMMKAVSVIFVCKHLVSYQLDPN